MRHIQELKEAFERDQLKDTGIMLRFEGVDGYDVYNCSVPFREGDGWYIYGRVERRTEWANSQVRLFERIAPDTYAAVKDAPVYALEDPFVQWIDGELVLGGTHVRKDAQGGVATYWCDFYRGRGTRDLSLFATGPDRMKDVRLIALEGGGVGVFSRPKGADGASIGYTEIPSLDALTEQVIQGAPAIENLMAVDVWGGCNQCYRLADGRIGVIGHMSYTDVPRGNLAVYTNVSFIFDPAARAVSSLQVIATRRSYPDFPAKLPKLLDCAFTSGILPRADGRVDLYSGIGDTAEGRIAIDNPFGQEIVWAGV